MEEIKNLESLLLDHSYETLPQWRLKQLCNNYQISPRHLKIYEKNWLVINVKAKESENSRLNFVRGLIIRSKEEGKQKGDVTIYDMRIRAISHILVNDKMQHKVRYVKLTPVQLELVDMYEKICNQINMVDAAKQFEEADRTFGIYRYLLWAREDFAKEKVHKP